MSNLLCGILLCHMSNLLCGILLCHPCRQRTAILFSHSPASRQQTWEEEHAAKQALLAQRERELVQQSTLLGHQRDMYTAAQDEVRIAEDGQIEFHQLSAIYQS